MASVVIIGAGVTGLVTAIGCARAGHRVTVLDWGPIPNPASTSSDQHRALRVLRPGDLDGTRRMAEARRRWLELESLLQTSIFRPVGVVTACTSDELDLAFDTARQAGSAATPVSPPALPPVVFPAGIRGVLDPAAGVLLADRFLHAATGWLAAHPRVVLRPGCAVAAVADHEVILADGTTLAAGLVLVAAGPWSASLVDLPVALYRQTMVYLRPPRRLTGWWATAPGVGRIGADRVAWLLPPGDGTVLKISSDAVCREVATITDPARESDPVRGPGPARVLGPAPAGGPAPADRPVRGPNPAAPGHGPWADRLLAEPILADPGDYTVLAVRDCHYATSRRDRRRRDRRSRPDRHGWRPGRDEQVRAGAGRLIGHRACRAPRVDVC